MRSRILSVAMLLAVSCGADTAAPSKHDEGREDEEVDPLVRTTTADGTVVVTTVNSGPDEGSPPAIDPSCGDDCGENCVAGTCVEPCDPTTCGGDHVCRDDGQLCVEADYCFRFETERDVTSTSGGPEQSCRMTFDCSRQYVVHCVDEGNEARYTCSTGGKVSAEFTWSGVICRLYDPHIATLNEMCDWALAR